jgi:hypothetical protein
MVTVAEVVLEPRFNPVLAGLGWDSKSAVVSMSARLAGGLGRGMVEFRLSSG